LAVQREIEKFVLQNQSAYKDLAEKDHEDIRVPFWELNDKFRKFSKHLVKTYDGHTHTNLPQRIAGFLYQDILKESDLDKFSPEGKQKLMDMLKWYD